MKAISMENFGMALEIVTVCERELWTNSPLSRGALDWLHKRGLADSTLRAWRIGFNPRSRLINGLWVENGITIPYFDGERALHAINVRRPDSFLIRRPKADKYKMVKGSTRVLFGTGHLTTSPNVLVTEGEFDALLVWQEASELVDILTMGAANGVPQNGWLIYLLGGQRFYIATDRDAAGDEAAHRWEELLHKRAMRVIPPSGKDITDFWKNGGDIRQWVIDLLLSEDVTRSLTHIPVTKKELAITQAYPEPTIKALPRPIPTKVSKPTEISLTLDQIATGELERQGWRVVGANLDLNGKPWAPKIYVQQVVS